MPPIGSQPVRAAMNISSNDIKSDGIESRISDADRIAPDTTARRDVAPTMPSGRPIAVARISAASARIAVLAARSGMTSRTGRS